MIRIARGITLDDRHIRERFVRAMGAGGQNPRREATAVELRLDVAELPPDVKDRLKTIARRSLTRKGVLVIVSRAHRSQAENREAAHARLVTLLQRAAQPLKERRATRPPGAMREERMASKKLRGLVKKSRSRSPEDQ